MKYKTSAAVCYIRLANWRTIQGDVLARKNQVVTLLPARHIITLFPVSHVIVFQEFTVANSLHLNYNQFVIYRFRFLWTMLFCKLLSKLC